MFKCCNSLPLFPGMKKGYLFIFLIFAFSFLLPLSCAYSSYAVIAEADFLTHGVKFEAVDTENLFVDKQNFATLSVALSPALLPNDNLLESCPRLFLSIPTICQASPLLRC